MKFKKILKRKMYETWFNKNRTYGFVSYIYKTPNYFHFSVSCYRKRCKNEKCINCNHKIRYSSLDNNHTYQTFEECVEAVKDWYSNHNI